MNRILYYMGIKDYMDRMAWTMAGFYLKSIAQNEASPQRHSVKTERVAGDYDESRTGRRKDAPKAGTGSQEIQAVILSTIHSSKGLEYDRFDLLDIVDRRGFPENVAESHCRKGPEGREAYFRRSAGCLRALPAAKNDLFVFKLDQKILLLRGTDAQGRPGSTACGRYGKEAGEKGKGALGEQRSPVYAVRKKAFSAEVI